MFARDEKEGYTLLRGYHESGIPALVAGLPYAYQTSPRICGIGCWIIPIFAGFVWLSTLLMLLITWAFKGCPQYPPMPPNQYLAYISDLGASEWGKPFFMGGSAISVFSFGISFAAERWLRHKGLLVHAETNWGGVCSVAATVFQVIGAAGVITLTIYDTRNYSHIHNPMIGVFIGGYILAAVSTCLEKLLIAMSFPTYTLLHRSFRIKLGFIILELLLTCIFAYTKYVGDDLINTSVVVEWFIALFFVFYMWSFSIDFLPVPVNDHGDVLDLEKVDLARDPERTWDRGGSKRALSADSARRHNRRYTVGAMFKVEHFQDNATGTKQYIKIT